MTFDTYINVVLLDHLEQDNAFEILSKYLAKHPEVTKPLNLEEAWRILGRA